MLQCTVFANNVGGKKPTFFFFIWAKVLKVKRGTHSTRVEKAVEKQIFSHNVWIFNSKVLSHNVPLYIV